MHAVLLQQRRTTVPMHVLVTTATVSIPLMAEAPDASVMMGTRAIPTSRTDAQVLPSLLWKQYTYSEQQARS